MAVSMGGQQPGFHGPSSSGRRVNNPAAVQTRIAGAEAQKNGAMDQVRQSRAASKPTDGQLPMRATSTARIPGAPALPLRNATQFATVGQGMKSAVTRLRTAKRLGSLLRRSR